MPDKRKIKTASDTLNAEDQALWARVTESIKPLNGKRAQRDVLNKSKQDQQKAPKQSPSPLKPPPEINQAPLNYSHGQAPGLDRRTQTRLRRGQITIEARLDLHGMTQAEAHDQLHHFLRTAYDTAKGCVLVITGKGLRGDGEIGVLRRAVPNWLNQPPVREWIKAFDHAAPRDGGQGALYILLRKRK